MSSLQQEVSLCSLSLSLERDINHKQAQEALVIQKPRGQLGTVAVWIGVSSAAAGQIVSYGLQAVQEYDSQEF